MSKSTIYDLYLNLFSGKIWALQYDNGEEVALLYTEKDTVRQIIFNFYANLKNANVNEIASYLATMGIYTYVQFNIRMIFIFCVICKKNA